MEAILTDNGLDIASAPLTQANVSLLYRYGTSSPTASAFRSTTSSRPQAGDGGRPQENAVPITPLNPFDPLLATPLAVLRDDRPLG